MREQKLHNILKDTFGYSSFRFEQLNIINSILDGKDTLAIMPTGGGKSLCYQIPALMCEGICLVISPLISLMQDQVTGLKEYNVEASFLNSTQTYDEQQIIKRNIVSGKVKLLYISPEGLLSSNILSLLRQTKVSLIAIDEAHCVSQWGHEFRNDYRRLHEAKLALPNTPILALTATADSKTREDITSQLQMTEPNTFISSFDRPNIKYTIQEREDELKQLNSFISANHVNDTGIVYCLSRRKVEKTAAKLVELGHKAIPYHAGMTTEDREKNQNRFTSEDNIIVVATIAFGMGIDKPDVRFVAHLDLPKSIEGYYQETGRAGRDGKDSTAWMVYGLQDVVKLSQMLENTDAHEVYKAVAKHKLDSMLSLCETAQCRRKTLLGYFGEEGSEQCGNCDTCISPAEMWDATVDAQKILSTIYRTNQTFGAGYIIDVLRGSENAKIKQRGHQTLTVYGIGKDKTKSQWNSILRQLMNFNYIAIKNWEYKSLCLTDKCKEILSEGKTLQLRKQNNLKELAKNKKSSLEANHGRGDLFEKLRNVRSELALENNIPPYIVFNDKTLHEMCVFLPTQDEHFLMLNGVGKSKLEKYGQIFMSNIQSYSAQR